jgi:transposase
MIVIGVDVHKHSLTAVAVDETGRLLAERTLQSAEDGLLAWAAELDSERLWVLEDCRHVTGAFERELVAAGERLLRVPPKLTAPEQRVGRARGKSDSSDALAAARASLREPRLDRPRAGEERLRELKLLVGHRDDLVNERRRAQQRLRWQLHELDATLAVPPGALDRAAQLERVSRWLARREQTVLVRIARDLVGRCCSLTRAILELERELAVMTAQIAPALLELPGCGRAHRRQAARGDRPDRALPNGRSARPSWRRRPARSELRARAPPPARPRRQPPTQLSAAPDRGYPGPRPPGRSRLPRAQAERRQEPSRSDPLPQTPARTSRL